MQIIPWLGVASSVQAPLLTIHASCRRSLVQGGACSDSQAEVTSPSM